MTNRNEPTSQDVDVESSATPILRVMLVDDHDVVRHGLKALLEVEDDLDVVVGRQRRGCVS